MWAILCGPFASFAQFAAKKSPQKSKKPAISSTKWSNFAKPKQTRAKARAHARYFQCWACRYLRRPSKSFTSDPRRRTAPDSSSNTNSPDPAPNSFEPWLYATGKVVLAGLVWRALETPTIRSFEFEPKDL